MAHQYVYLARLLSKDSPSGEMKAVVRECTIKGEEKQFLEVCGRLSGSDSALSLSYTLINVIVPLSLFLFPPVWC